MRLKRMALYSLAGLGVLYIGLSFVSFNASGKTQYIIKPIYKENTKYVPVGATLNNSQIDALVSYMYKIHPEEFGKIVTFYTGLTGSKEVAETILKECIEFNVPINLGFAMIKQESNFNPHAYNENENRSIDRGLCMLNSRAFPKWRWKDFYNLQKNAHAGIGYLGYLLSKYKDSSLQDELALSAYNEGESTIDRDKIHFSTSIHVFKIKNFESQYTYQFNSQLLPVLNYVKFSPVKSS